MFSDNIDNKNHTKTITFCSGKGGVGKSVITANIASCLANYGDEVIVLDSVLDLPNQQIIFGVEPPVRLTSVLSGKVDAEQALFSAASNIHLLVDSPVEYDEMYDTPASLNEVIVNIKKLEGFDYLLIDTQSGISDQLLGICLQSDLIIVIITDEPTSLLDAYGLVKILVNYINPEKITILVNNVIDSEDAVEISQKLNLATSKFLNIKLSLLGFVPYSRNVRLSIQRQEILVNNFTNDESTKSINDISEIIKSKYFSNSSINSLSEVRVNI
jgi:flagellar biosynthesis protein FlhG